jgi:nucleotide-binding universal stress UspA family protein
MRAASRASTGVRPEEGAMTTSGFRVVVATDGSREARAAAEAALAFPWPRGTRVEGVVASGRSAAVGAWSAMVQAALHRTFRRIADAAQQRLRRRWADAEVSVVTRPPVEAILGRAPRDGHGAIVLGRRGHSALGRLLLGSVSRGVVRRAGCPTLVVPRRAPALQRFVIGVDGSAHCRRAVDLLARCPAPARGLVTVVRVVEPTRPPSLALMPRGVAACSPARRPSWMPRGGASPSRRSSTPRASSGVRAGGPGPSSSRAPRSTGCCARSGASARTPSSSARAATAAWSAWCSAASPRGS